MIDISYSINQTIVINSLDIFDLKGVKIDKTEDEDA